MKKSTRLLKRFAALLLVVLMSIENFAAVVSDNDGAAFITKAEYDSLKNNFQLKINEYNANIDNKIDSAINSYITGVKQSKSIYANVINSKWEEVSSINEALKNTYKVPSVDLSFQVTTRYCNSTTATNYDYSGFWYFLDHYSRVVYNEDWSCDKNCYRVLVDSEIPLNHNYCYWMGYAPRYHEKIKIARIIQPPKSGSGAYWGCLDRPYEFTYAVTLRNLPVITGDGDVTNWDDVKSTRWPLTYLYQYYATAHYSDGSRDGDLIGSTTQSFPSEYTYDFFNTDVSLDPDDDGNKILYEHIIAYDKDTEWRVSNPNWKTLLNRSPESTINGAAVLASSSVTNLCRVGGIATHVTPQQNHMQTATAALAISADSIYPSIGLFSNKRKSAHIYQDNNEIKLDVANTKIDKKKPFIYEGLQLLAAPKDAVVTWEPTFNYTHVHNGANTYIDNNHEVRVYFSATPFTDNCTTTNLIRVKVDGGNTWQDYATTTDRSCSVEFKMPSTGIVYCKWVPEETTYFNNDWIVTLDLKNCNSYKYTIDA